MAFEKWQLAAAELKHMEMMLRRGIMRMLHAKLAAAMGTWQPVAAESLDPEILTTPRRPFAPNGGVKLLQGNLGRSVIKTSAVQSEHHIIEAPAVVIDDQDDLKPLFEAGALDKDCVVVVRFQGPVANGMPELHKLTPMLGVLQDKGHKVALVTDGRMSGASGKVPAAIHLVPEASKGGALAKIHNGDKNGIAVE